MGRGIAGLGSVVTTSLVWGALAGAAPPRDLRKLDVCGAIPGAEVARLVGGGLADSKPFNATDGTVARCVYGVVPAGADVKQRAAWVVEMFPPATFDELRPHVEQPVKDVAGLGDGAFEYKDPDSGRWRLYAHRRGDVTLSVTGTDEPTVRRIVSFVLSRP